MSSPSTTVSPISSSNDWIYYVLAGQTSPGTIPNRGGIRGFKRETGWDIKHGKGTQGATLTLKTLPPVEGSIDHQLITDNDFANWDSFVINKLSISPAKQKAAGLSIYYPGFASIGLTAVVVKHYTGPVHQGKGLYIATVEYIEWSKPPATSIVSTVTGSISLAPIEIRGDSPEKIALENQLAALNRANKP